MTYSNDVCDARSAGILGWLVAAAIYGTTHRWQSSVEEEMRGAPFWWLWYVYDVRDCVVKNSGLRRPHRRWRHGCLQWYVLHTQLCALQCMHLSAF